MDENGVDIFGISKVNKAWHIIPTANRLHAITAEWFEARHLAVAWNQNETLLFPVKWEELPCLLSTGWCTK